jgi:hypothetical protein
MIKTQWEPPQWSKNIAWVIFFACIASSAYRYINPTAREDRAILNNLAGHDIQSISIEPARPGLPTVVNRPMNINDAQSIAVISSELSGMYAHKSRRPVVFRAVILRIRFKDRVLGGYLEESTNNGTTFYCMSDVTKGWTFGTYSVPRGHELFNYIEQLKNTSAVPKAGPVSEVSG